MSGLGHLVAQRLRGDGRPFTMRQRRLLAVFVVGAVVVVIAQLVLGAWVLAAFWTAVAALMVASLVIDARHAMRRA